MGAFKGRADSRAALCALLAAALAACGGGGDGGEGASSVVAVEPVPAASITWQAPQAVPPPLVVWQSTNTIGKVSSAAIVNASLAVDNDGTAYFVTPTLNTETPFASAADARVYRHPFAGAWERGVVLGAPVGTRGGIPGVIAREYEAPQIKLDDAGNAFAIYTLVDHTAIDERDYVSQVLVRRRDAATGTWGAETALGSVPGAYQSAPRIVVERAGEAWAVWTERTVKDPVQRAGDLYAVFASRFAGSGWSTAERVSPDLPLGVGARIDTDKRGNPRVLVGANQVGLYYSARTNAGVWSPLSKVANLAQAELVGYEMAVDADDNALVVWSALAPAARGTAVSSRSFTPAGSWGNTTLLVPDRGIYQGFAFAADSAGNAFLLYQQNDAARPAFMLYAARFDRNRGWLSGQRISNFTGDFDNTSAPTISFDGSGNAIAVWTQSRTAASGTELRTASYSVSRGWGINETISAGLGGTAYGVQLAMSRTGSATVVWSQYGSGSGDLWSATRPASAGF